MKTLKCIDYQQGKIFVDEQAEIKEGDSIICTYGDGDIQVRVNKNDLKLDNFIDSKFKTKVYHKIIAQTPNLNLEGIPFIELEEDIICPYPEHTQNAIDWHNGYTSAQPKQFTLEQMKEAIEMARKFWKTETAVNQFTYEQIIQQLQPKIESVEVEWLHKDEPHLNGKSTITDRPITYQKDGRTYLKVNKINYENS
jgi:hypothetical protein